MIVIQTNVERKKNITDRPKYINKVRFRKLRKKVLKINFKEINNFWKPCRYTQFIDLT